MPVSRDDQLGRLDRLDNELAAARGLRDIALYRGGIEYDHYEAVIDGLIAERDALLATIVPRPASVFDPVVALLRAATA